MGAQSAPWPAKAAGVTMIVGALGFGVPMPMALAHLARHGDLPMTPLGFRTYAGPFEQLGPGPFALLGAALMGVAALNAVAGLWLVQGRRRGAVLGLVLTPIAIVLGLGFALPFWLAAIPAQTALVLLSRRRLR